MIQPHLRIRKVAMVKNRSVIFVITTLVRLQSNQYPPIPNLTPNRHTVDLA